MADIFNGIVGLTDHSDFLSDANLQSMLKRLIQGTYGWYSRSIKTGAYAATSTTLWLQIDDTTDLPTTDAGVAVQKFDVLYYDASDPNDVKYLWWQELQATDPGDGTLAIQLLNDTSLEQQSHTLGTGDGEFSLANATVTYFRIFLNNSRPITFDGGTVAQLLFPPSASQSVAASTLILRNARAIQVNGSGGDVTVTSTPSVQAGQYQGQKLIIIGGANAVTLQDETVLSGSTLSLGSYQRQLSQGDQLELRWMTNGSQSWWVEDNFKAFESY